MKPIYNIQGFDNPNNGYVKDYTELVQYGNRSEEDRIKVASTLASVSRGKDTFNHPEKGYKRLLTEAAMNTGSRPIEFILVELDVQLISVKENPMDHDNTGVPCFKLFLNNNKSLNMSLDIFNNYLGRYSYLYPVEGSSNDFKLRTNLRALLNAKIPYEDIPYNDFLKDAKAIKLNIPMFVFNQLITHTAFSKESRSERVVTLDKSNLWLPEDFYQRVIDFDHSKMDRNLAGYFIPLRITVSTKSYEDTVAYLYEIPSKDLTKIFRELGYPKEIFQRVLLELRYKVMVMVAWDEPNTWLHLYRERSALPEDWKNWTQEQTKQAVLTIKDTIGCKYLNK